MNYNQRKNKAAIDIFDKDRCQVCDKRFTEKRAAVFHHKWYKERGEVRHSDYENKHDYLTDLIDEMWCRPSRFAVLCNSCHQAITRMTRWKPERFDRLVGMARQSMW